jgi:hypothetical protein
MQKSNAKNMKGFMNMKKIVALLLTFMMIISVVPAVFAANAEISTLILLGYETPNP